MAINEHLARAAEKVARRIWRERGLPEGLWQMVLQEAYAELVPVPEDEGEGHD